MRWISITPFTARTNRYGTPIFKEANPEVPGVAGVMTVYHQVIPTLRFSGPPYFAGVLGKAVRWVWDG